MLRLKLQFPKPSQFNEEGQMKGVIGLAVAVVIAYFVGVMLLSHETTKEQDRLMLIAFGPPLGDRMQFQIGIAPVITLNDPPELNNRGVALWDEWIAAHFQLKDAGGKDIRFNKMGTSAAILDRTAGAPEFVLYADLQKGAEYTVDFVPVIAEKKRWRYTFTVPGEPQEVGRRSFAYIGET